MEKLNSEALAVYLKAQGLEPDLAERLKAEKVDGKQFLRINADLLRSCGFAMGDIFSILDILKQPFNASLSCNFNEQSSVASNLQQVNPTNNGGDSPTSERSNGSHTLDHNSFDENSEEEKEREKNLNDMLLPYFTEAELLEKSIYDKESLCSLLTKYHRMKNLPGVNADLCKPSFVMLHEQKQAKLKKQCNPVVPKRPSRASRRLKATPVDSPTQSESSCTRAAAGGSSRVPPGPLPINCNINVTPDSQVAGSSRASIDNHQGSCTQAAAGGSSRVPPGLLPINCNINVTPDSQVAGSSRASIDNHQGGEIESDINNGDDDDDEDDDDDTGDRIPGLDYDTPPFDLSVEVHLTTQLLEVSSKDAHLPNFNIYEILNQIFASSNDRLKEVIIKLKNGSPLKNLERKRIMRALALFLYNHHSPAPNVVTPAMKEGLAKSFVLAFPSYLVVSADGRKPWGLIFNKGGTGFLANACRAPQRKRQVKRRKTTKTSNPAPAGHSEYDSDYAKEMALIMPDRANKVEILNAMRNTFTKRQADREKKCTITEIILKYPHFTSYNGEVLREEFKRLLPEAKDGSREFLKLLPQILQLTEKRPISFECDDDVIKGLLLVAQYLPHDIVRSKKNPSHAKLEGIAAILKPGEDIEAYIEDNANKGKPVQPYLILVKALIGKKIVRTFLVLDRKSLQLTNATSVALDALFKFYVFNVQYPAGWCNTFHFLATCFYNVFEKNRRRPDCIAPNEHELFTQLGGKF